jgi:flavin-dependent dehydrogenase
MHGVTVRFDTEFISFQEISDKLVETKLHDRVNGHEYVITSKFLVGADGANSKVVTQLGLELIDKPKGPIALNILCEVDLSKYMDARVGNLTWVRIPWPTG